MLGRARARLSPPTLVLMYHRVAAVAHDPWGLAVTPAHFGEHLEVLRRQRRLLTGGALTRALASGHVPQHALTLTLDDGYADNLLEARPLLERHDVPATIFVAAGCLGRPDGFWWDELERLVLTPVDLPPRLSLAVRGRIHEHDLAVDRRYPVEAQKEHAGWRAGGDAPTGRHRMFLALYRLLRPLRDAERRQALSDLAAWAGAVPSGVATARPLTVSELRALAGSRNLLEVGAHTLTHPQLSALDLAEQRAEIRGSRIALQELVGKDVVSFAYPYGAPADYTSETVGLVRAAGFSGAWVTAHGVVTRDASRFELPRFHVEDCDGDGFARRPAEWTRAPA
jgi:peptidoglycan/xylan/chitin deacetylase (PgdA/CDA1 family)